MHEDPTSRLPVIALAGPTASGKSAAALAVAQHLGSRGARVEIVSVDSALVYRGMDIGTAKPTLAEQAEVPHHLIDLIDPSEAYSAARFVDDCEQAIAAIRARGALPLLVGGTMLYLKALRDGLDLMPPADPGVRAALDARAASEGWPALHAELARVDPVTAARLPPGDSQRIQRALEVWMVSGKPLSAWHRAPAETTSTDGRSQPSPHQAERRPLVLHLISLEPASRSWLHERIAQRFDAMLAAGLLDEVRTLRARGDLHTSLPSMRCVGYRQAWEALDAFELSSTGQPSRGASRLEDEPRAVAALRDAGIAATRQLAKRQLTWLRSMPDRQVVACDAPDAVDQVIRAVDRQLKHA
jgi:tRNA dimethylallyltransferase